jgi:D-glycero-D-manno-heptose 1,7-bisphosphate phosphatase
VFIDRDGTLIHERHYLRRIKDVRLFADAARALRLLRDNGFKLVMVSNQSGIARGYFTEEKVLSIHRHLQKVLERAGVPMDAMYYCPHGPDDRCTCRKPALGMVRRASRELGIDLKRSFTIGDHQGDFLLGQRMGGAGIFVLTGHGKHEFGKLRAANLQPHYIARDILSAARWIVRHK